MSITKNDPKSNGEEEMQVLNDANGDKPSADDPEKAATDQNGRRNERKKQPKRSEGQTLLLGPAEIEHYRKDPLWKALRFALFGSLICLFLLLVVVAVLIVALSSNCAGGNEIGGTATTIDLLLVVDGTTERAKFGTENSRNPSLISLSEGDSAFLHCDNSGAKIRWHRMGQNAQDEIALSKNVELFDNGTLQIRNAKQSDLGEYICEGMAPFGGQWHRLESVKLERAQQGAKATTTERQPHIKVSPSFLSLATSVAAASSLSPPNGAAHPRVDSYLKLAFADERVHFRCWMAGKSSEDLSWHKVKDAQREAGEGVSLLATEPDGHSAFLIFGTVKQSDAGEYECVEGRTGASSPIVRLRVEPSRTPVIEPSEQLVPEHSPAQIRCSVPGHSDAQLIWRRENGVKVGTLKGVTDDNKGTLRIAEVRREHELMGWVCWAVYAQTVDKQALSAGPVVIKVIPGREDSEEEGETKEKQRNEEGSGQDEETEVRGREEEEKQEGNNAGEGEQSEEEEKKDNEKDEEETAEKSEGREIAKEGGEKEERNENDEERTEDEAEERELETDYGEGLIRNE